MLIAVDFDGVIVKQLPGNWDQDAPLVLIPGAMDTLKALKAAGHRIIVYSARANRSLRKKAKLDPMVRAGLVPKTKKKDRKIAKQRYRQMKDFICRNMVGCYDAIDDGRQGKLLAAVFIDDKGMGFGPTATLSGDWRQVQSGIAMMAALLDTNKPNKPNRDDAADPAASRSTYLKGSALRVRLRSPLPGADQPIPPPGTAARVIHDLQQSRATRKSA